MESTDREYSMVYSLGEMQSKVEELKMKGYNESDIHVLVEDDSILLGTDEQSGIHTHEANSMGGRFKSIFTGQDAVRTELAKLQLDNHVADAYQQDLKNGAILLYTEHKLSDRGQTGTATGERNTAIAPFGRDVERDEMQHDDPQIHDDDVTVPASRTKTNEIYTSDVSREDQHGDAGYGDKTRDSRLQGENIHPTGGGTSPNDEGSISEKTMDHEPALLSAEGQDNLNREEGINRRQDEQSPGVDPNLGPAPFGRDSEEEHLMGEHRDDLGEAHDSREENRAEKERNKKDDTPPTQRLF